MAKRRGRPRNLSVDYLKEKYQAIVHAVVREADPDFKKVLAEEGFPSKQSFEDRVLRPLKKTWGDFYRDVFDLSNEAIGVISLEPIAALYMKILAQADKALDRLNQLAVEDPEEAEKYKRVIGPILSMVPQVGGKLTELKKFQMTLRMNIEDKEEVNLGSDIEV